MRGRVDRPYGVVPAPRTVSSRLADELVAPPALGELAAEMGVSRYRVVRGFGEVRGMPPYAWLAQHRVTRARSLLDAGLRPAEVATRVGFADQAHLTRVQPPPQNVRPDPPSQPARKPTRSDGSSRATFRVLGHAGTPGLQWGDDTSVLGVDPPRRRADRRWSAPTPNPWPRGLGHLATQVAQ
ncbi:helix-turn-helix domain-containing protein [Actinomadura sp. SCN-SB]|uniref:helix-turn-helix domain-containing protein n=1 Tax=Actinomadura sp. SCN-SB TaxID=3373092 RepID=UPI0037518C9A